VALAAADAGDATKGTWSVTVVPPRPEATARPRDVALVLDRSGSMGGWKLVAARRAAARVVDALGADDRFCVLAFDHIVEHPAELGDGLVPAVDRNRFAAVRWLGRLEARGGTELLAPVVEAADALAGETGGRDRVLVLVTDGQVANEDQVLRALADRVGSTRVFALGVDQAVNGAFLQRIAAVGAGRCDLVEGEDRLDEVLASLHRRISPPVLREVRVEAPEGGLVDASTVPDRAPDCFAAGPVTIAGRWNGSAPRQLRVTATTASGEPWETTVTVPTTQNPAVRAVWARAHVRDLEDRYAAGATDLAAAIVRASLDHGVLSRFTAFVAVDRSQVTTSTAPVAVIQPVEPPAGWLPMVAPGGPMQPMQPMAAAPMALSSMAGASWDAAPPPAARVSGGRRARMMMTPDDARSEAPSRPSDALAPWRARVTDLLDRLEVEGPSAGLIADLATLVDDLESVGDPADLASMVRLLLESLQDGTDPGPATATLRTALAGRTQNRRRTFWR
jgi:Ca-activated chloride channel family protein